MPIDWIPTNPKTNVKNQANQVAMAESEFNEFMRMIIHVCFLIDMFLFIFKSSV